jgi:tetratricopeptide (TPR) repeat protein
MDRPAATTPEMPREPIAPPAGERGGRACARAAARSRGTASGTTGSLGLQVRAFLQRQQRSQNPAQNILNVSFPHFTNRLLAAGMTAEAPVSVQLRMIVKNARAHGVKGELDAARTCFERALQMARAQVAGGPRGWGPIPKELFRLLEHMNALACSLGQKQSPALSTLFREVLGQHPGNISALKLARMLQKHANFEEAEKIIRRTLEAVRLQHGPVHHVTLDVTRMMAGVIAARSDASDERLEAAAEYYRYILRHRDEFGKRYNRDVPKSMSSQTMDERFRCLKVTFALHNLAKVLTRLGQVDAAFAAEDKAFKERRTTLGFDHPDTMASLLSLCIITSTKKAAERPPDIENADDDDMDSAETVAAESNAPKSHGGGLRFPVGTPVECYVTKEWHYGTVTRQFHVELGQEGFVSAYQVLIQSTRDMAWPVWIPGDADGFIRGAEGSTEHFSKNYQKKRGKTHKKVSSTTRQRGKKSWQHVV